MPDIRAAKVQEKEVRSYLDKMESEMVDALRQGNIFEVFAKSKIFKIGDFQDFFQNQWKMYKGELIQDETVKAMYATYMPPDIERFAIHNKSMVLVKEDANQIAKDFHAIIVSSGKSKSMTAKAKEIKMPGAAEDPNAAPAAEQPTEESKRDEPLGLTELQDQAHSTLQDYDSFMGDVWMQIMDAQMMSEYQTKMAEVKKEVDRLIALAKQGKIGPEFVLIALAKVNSMKSGVMISWLGKKAFHVNDSITKLSEGLKECEPGSMDYYARLQDVQSQTRDKSFQLNLLTQDLQKVMQDVASVLEQVNSMIAEMNRTRREIISRFGGR